MKKISIGVIKEVLSENQQDMVDIMIEKEKKNIEREKEEKRKEKEEKRKEKEELDNINDLNFICKKLEDGNTYDGKIEELVDSYDWHDTFYDYNGMDDAGDDTIEYFLIEGKLYEVELFCEAEWVGDWSVRKNLPGDVSITKITEVKSFEIIKDYGDSGTIKILK